MQLLVTIVVPFLASVLDNYILVLHISGSKFSLVKDASFMTPRTLDRRLEHIRASHIKILPHGAFLNFSPSPDPTPVYNHLEAHSPQCPSSWFQYDRFCVTPARAGTERAVALYCDSLGGIGVNGLCVISK